MATNKQAKSTNIPTKQGKSKVGYKQPPEEHQFQPGQSGNPNGPPKRRTQLWLWLCKYMALNDAELEKLDAKELTQAQQTALKLVKNAKEGKYSGSERLARYVIDRDEGKALSRLVVEDNKAMSTEEREKVREILRRNFEASEVFRAEKFLNKQKDTGE